MLCASCTTNSKPQIVVETKIERERIPPALLQACPSAFRKPILKTADFVTRGDVNETALRKCAAQVNAIKKWDERP